MRSPLSWLKNYKAGHWAGGVSTTSLVEGIRYCAPAFSIFGSAFFIDPASFFIDPASGSVISNFLELDFSAVGKSSGIGSVTSPVCRPLSASQESRNEADALARCNLRGRGSSGRSYLFHSQSPSTSARGVHCLFSSAMRKRLQELSY